MLLWRESRTNQAKQTGANRLPSGDEVREQAAAVADELGEALEAAKDAIAKAMLSAGRRGSEASAEATRRTAMLGKEASRKGVAAGRRMGRRARGAAFDAVGHRLPEPEQVAELTRKATERVFPEVAKQYRKNARKRQRRLMYGGAGLAAVGMLIGWLTAPKKGGEVRQALKERANAAGDKVAEMRASAGAQRQPAPSTPSGVAADSGVGSGTMAGSGSSGGTSGAGATGAEEQHSADVTPIHPTDGATASRRR